MSGIHERERNYTLKQQSPLRFHSMNQGNLKDSFDLERKINVSRKVFMAQRRRERHIKEAKELQHAKVVRVLSRVLQSLSGYDGANLEVLESEIRYLKRSGIVLNFE